MMRHALITRTSSTTCELASGAKPMTYYHDSTITLRLENFDKHVRVNIPLTNDGDVIALLFASTSDGDNVYIGTLDNKRFSILERQINDWWWDCSLTRLVTLYDGN